MLVSLLVFAGREEWVGACCLGCLGARPLPGVLRQQRAAAAAAAAIVARRASSAALQLHRQRSKASSGSSGAPCRRACLCKDAAKLLQSHVACSLHGGCNRWRSAPGTRTARGTHALRARGAPVAVVAAGVNMAFDEVMVRATDCAGSTDFADVVTCSGPAVGRHPLGAAGPCRGRREAPAAAATLLAWLPPPPPAAPLSPPSLASSGRLRERPSHAVLGQERLGGGVEPSAHGVWRRVVASQLPHCVRVGAQCPFAPYAVRGAHWQGPGTASVLNVRERGARWRRGWLRWRRGRAHRLSCRRRGRGVVARGYA